MFEQKDYSSFLESIATVDDAQKAIREALVDTHERRREVDDREIMPPDFDDAITRLSLVLQNVPTDITSISVVTKFPRLVEKPTNNVEHEIRTLQFLMEQLDPSIKTQQDVDFTFNVKPNFYPPSLKKESHGSYARDLMNDVIQTLKVGYSSQIHVLYVKPYEAPEGISGIRAMNAKPFRIPLRYVSDISLNTEQKPLTPYLEGTDWEALKIVPVAYTST